jgi:hypothetical protein
MILNDAKAVKTFAQAGSLTLGGNVSVAAGPVGRNAEASGAASLRSIAGIFSYRYDDTASIKLSLWLGYIEHGLAVKPRDYLPAYHWKGLLSWNAKMRILNFMGHR